MDVLENRRTGRPPWEFSTITEPRIVPETNERGTRQPRVQKMSSKQQPASEELENKIATTESSATRPAAADSEGKQVKRVNITINPIRHEILTKFAETHGTSFSDLARRGAELIRNRELNDDVPREFQPLFGELQKIETEFSDFDTKIDQLQEMTTHILEQMEGRKVESSNSETIDEHISERLFGILKVNGPQSIPELIEKTGFDRQAVQRGIDQLRRTYVIIEVDSRAGVARWKVR